MPGAPLGIAGNEAAQRRIGPAVTVLASANTSSPRPGRPEAVPTPPQIRPPSTRAAGLKAGERPRRSALLAWCGERPSSLLRKGIQS